MATAKRDYYEVLGVTRECTSEELKRAYRKLAMQYHPDRNNGDKTAEERFKEIGEAYSVLSDPEKRQRYDAFGHAGTGAPPDFGPFSFDSAFDLFDMFFGGGGRRRSHGGPQRGADLRMTVDVAFEEAVFGAKRTIEVPRAEACRECGGSGARAGTKAAQCATCHGAGQVRRTMQSIFGQVTTASPCPACRGEGRVIDDPCPACRGQGRVESRHSVEVTIPPGVDEDVTLRLSGEGEAGPRGGATGDLYIGFRVKPHPQLVRHGQDVVYELPITIPQAVLGDTITVPTVTGEHQVAVPPGTQPGKQIKLHGLGVPHVRSGRRGDQICLVRVVVPSHLNHQDRELYEQLGGRDGVPAEVKRGFFDSVRDAFRG
ncbi:MAG: molecular chaperone DnaJ [Candidatus Dormibacteraeota bacterium]|nr:molecular chaperone DnaJ [Candidatus Dormibacteraeota bacterium]